MSSVAVDMKTVLESVTLLQLEFGVNLFISLLPDLPNACTAIYDGIPLPDDVFLDGTDNVEETKILIIHVRNTDYNAAYDLAADIKAELIKQNNVEIDGTNYIYTTCIKSPHDIGWDEKKRVIFEIVFEIKRSI